MCLEDDSGKLYESEKDILNSIFSFFKNLYQIDHLLSKRLCVVDQAHPDVSLPQSMLSLESPFREMRLSKLSSPSSP